MNGLIIGWLGDFANEELQVVRQSECVVRNVEEDERTKGAEFGLCDELINSRRILVRSPHETDRRVLNADESCA